MNKIKNRKSLGTPVLLVGDFNAPRTTEPIKYIQGEKVVFEGEIYTPPFGLKEAYTVVNKDKTKTQGPGIDLIFSNKYLKAVSTKTIRTNWNGVNPSDHRPIEATYQWNLSSGMPNPNGDIMYQGNRDYSDEIMPSANVIATGPLSEQIILGNIIPDDDSLGQAGKVFVLVNLAPFTDPSGFKITTDYMLWSYDGNSLSLILPQATLEQICATLPAYYSGPLQVMENMPLISAVSDLTLFAGSEIYIGYGSGDAQVAPGTACMDMVANGTLWPVHTLK